MRKVRTHNEMNTWETQGGVSLWKVPQKTIPPLLSSKGKGENVR